MVDVPIVFAVLELDFNVVDVDGFELVLIPLFTGVGEAGMMLEVIVIVPRTVTVTVVADAVAVLIIGGIGYFEEQ